VIGEGDRTEVREIGVGVIGEGDRTEVREIGVGVIALAFATALCALAIALCNEAMKALDTSLRSDRGATCPDLRTSSIIRARTLMTA
jgi:hypothetical protein